MKNPFNHPPFNIFKKQEGVERPASPEQPHGAEGLEPAPGSLDARIMQNLKNSALGVLFALGFGLTAEGAVTPDVMKDVETNNMESVQHFNANAREALMAHMDATKRDTVDYRDGFMHKQIITGKDYTKVTVDNTKSGTQIVMEDANGDNMVDHCVYKATYKEFKPTTGDFSFQYPKGDFPQIQSNKDLTQPITTAGFIQPYLNNPEALAKVQGVVALIKANERFADELRAAADYLAAQEGGVAQPTAAIN